jgi:nucleoside-diphosphate-sugar epimerase
MKKHTVWLTGSGGFIGSRTAPVLSEAFSELRCFSNNPEAARVAGGRFSRIYMDYSSERDIQRAVTSYGIPDVLVHLGWGAMEDPTSAEHLERNVRESNTLMETLFKAGLGRFVFLGSVNEYGARIGALSENMPAEGRLTNYAKGKALVAQFGFEKAAEFGKTFISIRLFYTYGAGQRGGSLINKLYRCCRTCSRADLGPCEHYRDYIHVSEVAEGIRRISEIEKSTIVNLGSGRVIQVRDFVTSFWRLLNGSPGQLAFGAIPMRVGEPEQPRSYADTERLKNLTGWTPSLSIEDGIRLTIRGLQEKDVADSAGG